MYVLILFLGTATMCLSLTPQVEEKLLENVSYFLFYCIPQVHCVSFFFMWNFGWFQLSHFRSTCKLLNTGENCELLVGYMAVYRIAITLSAFFFFMSLITVGLRTSQGWRANFHNGCWIWKFLILIGISIGIMCIPNEKIAHFQLGISSEHDSSLRLYSQWLSMTRTFSMTLYYLFIKYIYC